MAENDGTDTTHIQLELGYYGALRLHLEPVVEFVPERKAQVVEHATATKLTLEGTHKNVVNAIPCQLTWVIETDRVRKTVDHPRKTVVEPSGARVKVREWVNDSARDLQVDAFELGLVGDGQLGYKLKLDLLGAVTIERSPQESGIEVKLAANVSFTPVPPPDSDGTASPTPPPQASSTPSGMLVGKPYKVTAQLADGWNGCHATLHLASYAHDLDVKGTAQEIGPWKVGEGESGIQWRVGMRQVPPDGYLLTYHSEYPEGHKHRVGWVLTLSRPDPANAKKQQTLALPVQMVGEFAHPSLTELSLDFVASETPEGASCDGSADIVLTAAFSGFNPSCVFPVEAELYGRFSSAPPDGKPHLRYDVMVPFHELPTSVMLLRPDAALEPAKVLGVPTAVCHGRVEGGRLEAVLLRAQDLKRSGLSGPSDLELFGAVRFSPSVTGSPTSVTFQRVADFSPGDGDAGFAPMRDGKLVVPAVGLAVCSNLLSLTGATGRLEGPGYDSIDVMALAACIWTETHDANTTDLEIRCVGGVICNRYQNDDTSILKVVLQPYQFSYFNDDSPLKSALQSANPARVERWASDLQPAEKAVFERAREIAQELLDDPGKNPFDASVQHFLSPRSMKGGLPSWATGDKAVEVAGIPDDRFRFYRGVSRPSSAGS